MFLWITTDDNLDTLVRFPAVTVTQETIGRRPELDANLGDPRVGENDKPVRDRKRTILEN